MVKKYLLIFAILFAPCVVYAGNDDDLVINLTAELTEKILPLDTKALNEAFHLFVGGCGYNSVAIEDAFWEGKMKIPFSVQDLIKLCRENLIDMGHRGIPPHCKRSCTDVAKKYYKLVSEKAKSSAVSVGAVGGAAAAKGKFWKKINF